MAHIRTDGGPDLAYKPQFVNLWYKRTVKWKKEQLFCLGLVGNMKTKGAAFAQKTEDLSIN